MNDSRETNIRTISETDLMRALAYPLAHRIYVTAMDCFAEQLPYDMPPETLAKIADTINYGADVVRRLFPDGNPHRAQGLLETVIAIIQQHRTDGGSYAEPGGDGLYDCIPDGWIKQLDDAV
jgi:hypothetical protein